MAIYAAVCQVVQYVNDANLHREDIYLKENFMPLIDAGGVSVIHPDLLTAGGMLRAKIGDYANEHGVAVAMHMAESPVVVWPHMPVPL